ncbi:MAG TPA: RodZ family helix-turn-helix domain-containing protein [Gammaproteobacteria bacterium]|nr:RodZ family helix-turn-helix domain-containing protein [Gammaproteobacteria bacterium]
MAADPTHGPGADERVEVDAGEALPIGQRLRAGRERVSLSEAQVAQALNLDQSVVHALEAGDFDSLGAPIFVKGHLRNYARLVKIDPAEIIAAYEVLERTAPPDLPARSARGVKMDEHGGWGSRIAWLVLALIVAALGWWLYQTNQLSDLVRTAQGPETSGAIRPLSATQNAPATTNDKANSLTPLPRAQTTAVAAVPRPSSAMPAGGQAAAPLQGATQSSTGATTGVDTEKAPTATVTESPTAPTAATISNPVMTPEAQTRANLRQAEAEGGLPIALRLTGDSWVEVDDASGKRLYYGLANQGETLYITGQPPLSVFLGNAQHVRVLTAGNVIDTGEYTRSDETARFTIHKLGDNPAYADDPSKL